MIRLPFLTLAAAAAAAFAQTPAHPPAPAAPAAKPALAPGLYATFHTSAGIIVAQLFEKETPLTVRNFTGLARGTKSWADPKTHAMIRRPMYNGITFHRTIAGFMIQSGDPTGSGSHNCGFTIKDEIRPDLKFDRPGRLAMANIGSPNTGACQWFITEVPYPSLNGGFTIFGQVVEGQDVVTKIAHMPTRGDKPVNPVNLIRVTFHREGPPSAPTARHTTNPAAKKSPAKK